ncbi:MAG: hypothetical protein DKT66_20615 [Candidatus Melainabacteria bacterium]|nr:MAG: hypothetical protein DKT66_20615 [Candidatus Melainabacteria bacterium]
MPKNEIENSQNQKSNSESIDVENGSENLNTLDILLDARSQFERFDKSGDKKVTRDELRIEIQQETNSVSGNPELNLLKNFTEISGGDGSISKADIDRAIVGKISSAIEAADSTSPLSLEVRSGIARWADISNSARDSQNQLNTALAGTGKHISIAKLKFMNYLAEQIPSTTFTVMEGNVALDQFTAVQARHAQHSLVAGESLQDGNIILDGKKPFSSCDPALRENMAHVRTLHHLMNDPILRKEGTISLEAMTKYQSKTQEQKYAKFYLQLNFGKLADNDSDSTNVSKADLRKEMEESISSLIAKSLTLNQKQHDELVDRFIRTTLQDEYLGLSKTFSSTLNAALEKEGYSASISPKSDKAKTNTGEFIRTLSIENKSNQKQGKVLNFLTRDPSLSYKGYEQGYSSLY